MGGMLAARHDPAVVFIPGGRRSPVFDCEPRREGWNVWKNVRARRLAIVPFMRARHLPPLDAESDDELHVRGYANTDRPRLSHPLPARVQTSEMGVDCAGRHPGRVLGSMGSLPRPGTRVR